MTRQNDSIPHSESSASRLEELRERLRAASRTAGVHLHQENVARSATERNHGSGQQLRKGHK